MKIPLITLALFCQLAYITPLMSADHPELHAFPAAKEKMERLVIVLPHKERGEEDGFMVELLVGKMMETDGVNHMGLGAAIQEKDLKGWGYTYYEVAGSGQAVSTLIGVPPGTPKVMKFVSGSPLKIRYNSRLPIVIYVPEGEGWEVRYRIWSAAGKFETATKG
jgi:ecotin